MRCFGTVALLVAFLFTSKVSGASTKRQTPSEGYINPANGGGSMLDKVPGTSPDGLGEPLNIIISANSDASVLDNTGIQDYFRSLNFSGECLGQHIGNVQTANLGDGNGYVNETAVMRYNFGRPDNGGTCTESIQGGNHFRYWVQANTKAIFMASSYEKSAKENHDIVVDGYNLGRNMIVGNITGSTVSNPTASSTFSGSTTSIASDNTTTTYKTDITFVSGLLSDTNDGVNHASDVGVNGKNAIDGLVAVFTVKQTGKGTVQPSGGSQTSSNTGSRVQLNIAFTVFGSVLALWAS
ncbi:hypothetical protein DL96DRAFT_908533 [Flagelloscypha sp. PMI_526]|nr:hypothetical protein DL96DRAFT_908533 [Flagelloscypha sp. PMI_526]